MNGDRYSLCRVLLGILIAMIVYVVPANAAIGHKLLSTFGSGLFTKATDVTVDQTNDNVYVTDSGANSGAGLIDVFGAEGGPPADGIETPLAGIPAPFHFGGEPSAVAVDEASGYLYVADARNNVVDKFTLNPLRHKYEYICQFSGFGSGCVKEAEVLAWEEPDGVAVNAAGNLYVASYGPHLGAVDEFSKEGNSLKQFLGIGIGVDEGPVGVAVDSSGNLYVNTYHRSVIKLDAEGSPSFLEEHERNEKGDSTAVAVDAHGNVYIDDGSYIDEYNQQGRRVSVIGIGPTGESEIGESEGIAVDDSTEDIYVSSPGEGDPIKVFGPPVTVPTVVARGVTKTHKMTTTIDGDINPEGEGEVKYYVQYGTGTEYGLQTAEESIGEGRNEEPISIPLTGLSQGTAYHYRIVAINKNGPSYGEDHEFMTAGVVNVVNPCTVIDAQATSAVLTGITDPEGVPARYSFQYAEDSKWRANHEYEVTTSPEARIGEEEEPIIASVTGLVPNTLYHCRVIGENEFGEVDLGTDQTFQTLIARPMINSGALFATGIGPHEVTLRGEINPGNGVTTYHFIYGLTSAYGSSTPPIYTPLNYEYDVVEQLIAGLPPGALVHYALVTTNSSGTTVGPDEEFTTLTENAEPPSEADSTGGPSLEVTSTPGILQPSTPALLPTPVFPAILPIGSSHHLTCKKGFVKKGARCVRRKRAKPRKRRK
jgi:DNA-binding beta-propeller fold protein YncE